MLDLCRRVALWVSSNTSYESRECAVRSGAVTLPVELSLTISLLCLHALYVMQ